MEPNPLSIPAIPIDAVWPPPSTAHPPVYEFKFTHAITRSRLFLIWCYQPIFHGRNLAVTEHGISWFPTRPQGAYMPWSNIRAVMLARKRNQVCVSYGYPFFGFKGEAANIISIDQENYDAVAGVLRRFAKCSIVEDDKISWSYRKVMTGYIVFWLCDLSLIFSSHYHWTRLWGYAVGLLNRLVSIHLP